MPKFNGRKWIEENQGKHFCQCGCGEAIEIKIHHHVRGIPKFKNFHASKAMPFAFANYGAANGRYKGGRYIDLNGYVQVRINGKYYREHRIIIEELTGENLSSDDVVHHKNKNKSDNRIDNLEVMTNSDHTSLHARAGEVGFRLLQKKGIKWNLKS